MKLMVFSVDIPTELVSYVDSVQMVILLLSIHTIHSVLDVVQEQTTGLNTWQSLSYQLQHSFW